MDLRFNHLEQLTWLWAALAVVVLMLVAVARKKRMLRRFASAPLIASLIPSTSFARQYVRVILIAATLIALVAAMIDPRWGVRFEEVRQRGIDIVFVLDVSQSMLAEDVRPNRLQRAKQYIRDVVSRLAGDRVALVTTAGAAALRCPLTVDYGAFRLVLDEVDTESAARGGSLIGDGLRRAADAFTDEVKDYKVVMLLTDGEDHGSYPLEAAQQLREQTGALIYTVGIGDDGDGARIPVLRDDRGGAVYLKYDNREVWSKMNPAALRDIALAAGGAFIPVGERTVDMGEVYQQRIAPVAKREFQTTHIRRYTARYQWFAGLALALLLIDTVMTDRRAGGDARDAGEPLP